MHVNRGLLGWGVFFITLGGVPLAVRAGYLDPALVARAPELWPLLLVGIGLGLILARTKGAVIGGLVVAVTFGLIGGSVLSGGLPADGFSACGFGTNGGAASPFAAQSGVLASGGRVDLELNCAELDATSSEGTGWTVGGTADRGRPPEIRATGDRLLVRSAGRGGLDGGVRGSRWVVTLPREVGLTVGLSVNAGSARLDLAAMRVPELRVAVNAGDASVDAAGVVEAASLDADVNLGSLAISLPAPASTMSGSVSVNLGSLEVCVPDGVGLRIRTHKQALSSDNFAARGLTRDGDTWTRPGFEAASQRIELDVESNLGSITLNPEAGCG